jgi:peptidoglycan/LPS O-acetylase OafA/YrhL
VTTNPPRGFVPELDGLRGIAILAVMTHRMWRDSSITALGWIGVDLFFVISGFLICGILLDTRDEPDALRNFYARRVLRIFPLFYLFVGSMLLTFPLLTGSSYLEKAGSPLWYILQLGNIPEGVLRHDPPYWLAPVWSLAIEEQFYLSFPWLVRALDRRRLTRVLIAIVLLAPIVRTAGLVVFPQVDRFQYEFTLCRLDTIALGCLLAIVVRLPAHQQPRSRALASIATAMAVIAVVTGLDRTTAFGRTLGYTVVALGFAAIVLLVVRARGARGLAALRFAPLRYLGKICFGLYLLHRPADTIVGALAQRAGLDPGATLLVPLKMAAAVGLATMSWLLLERPFLRLKDRFSSRAHPLAELAPG